MQDLQYAKEKVEESRLKRDAQNKKEEEKPSKEEQQSQVGSVKNQLAKAQHAMATQHIFASAVDPHKVTNLFMAIWGGLMACAAVLQSRTLATVSQGADLGRIIAAHLAPYVMKFPWISSKSRDANRIKELKKKREQEQINKDKTAKSVEKAKGGFAGFLKKDIFKDKST